MYLFQFTSPQKRLQIWTNKRGNQEEKSPLGNWWEEGGFVSGVDHGGRVLNVYKLPVTRRASKGNRKVGEGVIKGVQD
jgi:hypothetical protein